MTSYLITGASLLGAKTADIGISEGVLVDPKDVAGKRGTTTLDASGLVAFPGFVDLHTHLRQPGGEQAETILSGS